MVVGANWEIGVRTFGGGGNYTVVVAHVGRYLERVVFSPQSRVGFAVIIRPPRGETLFVCVVHI